MNRSTLLKYSAETLARSFQDSKKYNEIINLVTDSQSEYDSNLISKSVSDFILALVTQDSYNVIMSHLNFWIYTIILKNTMIKFIAS
jgi:hypothetical protein